MRWTVGNRHYRWAAGSSFIAAWSLPRKEEVVPDAMLELPDWVNVSRFNLDAAKLLAPILDRGDS